MLKLQTLKPLNVDMKTRHKNKALFKDTYNGDAIGGCLRSRENL